MFSYKGDRDDGEKGPKSIDGDERKRQRLNQLARSVGNTTQNNSDSENILLLDGEKFELPRSEQNARQAPGNKEAALTLQPGK